MAGIKKTQDIVRMMLVKHPETRNSDHLLYAEVCKFVNPEVEHWCFCDALKYMKDLGLPAFETVRRTRQKLQAAFPELAACDEVQGFRMAKEEEFRDYARSITT